MFGIDKLIKSAAKVAAIPVRVTLEAARVATTPIIELTGAADEADEDITLEVVAEDDEIEPTDGTF